MIIDGWLQSAKPMKSPHFDSRPEEQAVSLLVIHNISLPPSEFKGHFVEEFFLGQLDSSVHPYFKYIASIRVSAHLYIRRNGDVIQFVSFNDRAWHAGVSNFENRENCNDFSIGIELEGADDIAYTVSQYQKLVDITLELQSYYPLITKQSIKGHCEIAPMRKTDPGESFDWHNYFSKLDSAAR